MIESKEERQIKAIQHAVRERKLKIGGTMRNGGIILQQALIEEGEWGNEYVVLAVVHGQFQPFVTWRRMIGIEQTASGGYAPLDYCWQGHYRRELMEALQDFESRVIERGGAKNEDEPTDRVPTDV